MNDANKAPMCCWELKFSIQLGHQGSGWSLDEIMQKATFFSMPLAVAVAEVYKALPRDLGCVPFAQE